MERLGVCGRNVVGQLEHGSAPPEQRMPGIRANHVEKLGGQRMQKGQKRPAVILGHGPQNGLVHTRGWEGHVVRTSPGTSPRSKSPEAVQGIRAVRGAPVAIDLKAVAVDRHELGPSCTQVAAAGMAAYQRAVGQVDDALQRREGEGLTVAVIRGRVGVPADWRVVVVG